MSKITNDGLTRFGTCKVLYIAGICTHMATMGVKGFSRTNRQTDRQKNRFAISISFWFRCKVITWIA